MKVFSSYPGFICQSTATYSTFKNFLVVHLSIETLETIKLNHKITSTRVAAPHSSLDLEIIIHLPFQNVFKQCK